MSLAIFCIGICRDRGPIAKATEATPKTVPETASIGSSPRGLGGWGGGGGGGFLLIVHSMCETIVRVKI